MTRPDRSRLAAIGCASVVVEMAMLVTAKAAGWIALPWAWFFLPVRLLLLAGAVLLGVFVVTAWAWLILAGAWAAIQIVCRRKRPAGSRCQSPMIEKPR